MAENLEDEFARRLREISDSVAGLSEEEAIEALNVRLRQAEAHGAALHRLSLARARGTLAAALGEGAEDDVITSLRDMVTTIEQSAAASVHLDLSARVSDPASAEFNPELAGVFDELLERHRENSVGILGVIARTSVAGDNPELVAELDALLAHDLEAMELLCPPAESLD